MNPDEQIELSWNEMKKIVATSGRDEGMPTTLIMNGDFFAEWFDYCEEHGLEPMEWEGKQILLDMEAPFPIAWSYHMKLT